MKTYSIRFWLLAILAIVGINSCQEEDLEPVLNVEAINAPEFQVPAQTAFMLMEDSAAMDAFTLSWSPVSFSTDIALADPTYDLQMILDGGDFSTPINIASTTGTSVALNTGDLNQTLIANGVTPGASQMLQFRIMATMANTNLMSVSSPVSIEVTTFAPSAAASIFDEEGRVGVIGTAVEGWDYDVDLFPVSEEDPNLLTRILYLNAEEIKFRQADDWGVNWGGSGLEDTGVQDGDNIVIPSAGYYSITFNLETAEYSIIPITPGDSYSTIGAIGNSIVDGNGWDSDLDMTPDVGGHIWSIELQIQEAASDNGLKFRADDDWGVNWGGEPMVYLNTYFGAAARDGSNFELVPGTYSIKFNDIDGSFYIECISEDCQALLAAGGGSGGGGGGGEETPTYESMGIIGSALTGGEDGWTDEAEVMLNQNGDYGWSIQRQQLFVGELKFRAEANWDLAWGDDDFPSDTAETPGGNIPIETEGLYDISFNHETLIYSITPSSTYETIGVIGSATAGGWDSDTDLNQNADDGNLWEGTVYLVAGEVKFRANDDWTDDWGDDDYPSETAEYKGANIPVSDEGYFNVSFNTETLAYSITEAVDLTTYGAMGVIGSATPGGWDADTDMTVDPNNPHRWTIEGLVLTEGEIKFRADDDWTDDWGDDQADFPMGFAEYKGGNIAVTAGTYNGVFDDVTGYYSFTCTDNCDGGGSGGGGGEGPEFESIGVIGSATYTGWDNDIDLMQSADDANVYSGRVYLTAGNAFKFRANNEWSDDWGDDDFPSNTAEKGGGDISVETTGYYDLSLNVGDNTYSMTLVEEELTTYSSMGVIGTATAGGWDADTDLTVDAENPHLWRAEGVVLTEGEMKIRANDAWDVSWGMIDSTSWPRGYLGNNQGDNVPVSADDSGTYTVLFDDVMGYFIFTKTE